MQSGEGKKLVHQVRGFECVVEYERDSVLIAGIGGYDGETIRQKMMIKGEVI